MSDQESVTAVLESVPCRLCETGTMRRAIIKPYNVNAGIALVLLGMLFLLTGVLGLIGLIAFVVGAYFILAKKDVWLCDKCGAIVGRA